MIDASYWILFVFPLGSLAAALFVAYVATRKSH